jgi:hypothetical protein
VGAPVTDKAASKDSAKDDDADDAGAAGADPEGALFALFNGRNFRKISLFSLLLC